MLGQSRAQHISSSPLFQTGWLLSFAYASAHLRVCICMYTFLCCTHAAHTLHTRCTHAAHTLHTHCTHTHSARLACSLLIDPPPLTYELAGQLGCSAGRWCHHDFVCQCPAPPHPQACSMCPGSCFHVINTCMLASPSACAEMQACSKCASAFCDRL